MNTQQDEEYLLALPTWFIFSNKGMCAAIPAETITKAIAEWRRKPRKDGAEIVGVIRAASAVQALGRVTPSHCFGVIVCAPQIAPEAPATPPGPNSAVATACNGVCNATGKGARP